MIPYPILITGTMLENAPITISIRADREAGKFEKTPELSLPNRRKMNIHSFMDWVHP
jgi:hypothetical protein